MWYTAISLTLLVVAAHAKQTFVTCGSMLQLSHSASSWRLHSHSVTYGHQGGSGQQSVTLYPDSTDTNNNFAVHGGMKHDCTPGAKLKKGDRVRLQHINTKSYVHSHSYKSPLSGNNEVSCFDGHDAGDDWIVEPVNSQYWTLEERVRFKHADTNYYLHATGRHQFGHPINGQAEVCGHRQQSGLNTWQAQEGVYLPAGDGKQKKKLAHDEL